MQLESLGWVLNPCARLSVQGGSEPPLFLVRAPIKGAQLSERLVRPDELPEGLALPRWQVEAGRVVAQD